MLKYLGILVVILGFAFIIARHDEYAALQSAQETANTNNPAVTGKADENHSQKRPKDSAWDSPSGHIFHAAFGWPEGTTIWVIILTLLAIAEQTHQTRRSADISAKALVSQFRPKIVIRKMTLDPSSYIYYDRRQDGKWKIVIQVANMGGTNAVITKAIGYFQEYRGNSPHQDFSRCSILEIPTSVQPGQKIELEYFLDAEKFRTFMSALEASTALKKKQPPERQFFTAPFAIGMKTESKEKLDLEEAGMCFKNGSFRLTMPLGNIRTSP